MENFEPSALMLLLSLFLLAGLATFFAHVLENEYSEGKWPKRYFYFFRAAAYADLFVAFITFLLKFIVPAPEQPLYPHFYRDLFASAFAMVLPLNRFYLYFKKRQMISTTDNDDQNM